MIFSLTKSVTVDSEILNNTAIIQVDCTKFLVYIDSKLSWKNHSLC